MLLVSFTCWGVVCGVRQETVGSVSCAHLQKCCGEGGCGIGANLMSDIIDLIDELVDAQLAEGESCSDYLNDDPEYPACPHCSRHWHGLRITKRIEEMKYRGRYDEDYSIATDDSAVLCEGSDFIGPQRPPVTWSSSLGLMPGWSFLGYMDDEAFETQRRELSWSVSITPAETAWHERHARVISYMAERAVVSWPRYTLWTSDWMHVATWTDEPEPVCTTPPPEGIEVEFGPQNWRYEFQRIPNHSSWTYVVTPNTRAVARLWDEFTAPDYPIPVAPGIDTAALEATMTAFGGHGPELPPLRQRGPA